MWTFIAVLLIVGAFLYFRKSKKAKKEVVSVPKAEESENTINQYFIDNGYGFRFPEGGRVEITKDEFDGNKTLRFRSTACFGLDKYMFFADDYQGTFFIGFRSENDKDLILFGSYQKEIKLQKGDEVIILFEDGSTDNFFLQEKGYKVDKDLEGVVLESYAVLSDDQILKFSQLEMKKWRLKTISEKLPLTGSLEQDAREEFKKVAFAYRYSLDNFYRNEGHITKEDYTQGKIYKPGQSE